MALQAITVDLLVTDRELVRVADNTRLSRGVGIIPGIGLVQARVLDVVARALAGRALVSLPDLDGIVDASAEIAAVWQERLGGDPSSPERAYSIGVLLRLREELALAPTAPRGRALGEYLQHLREAAGLTRRQVALALGVDKHTVYRWEHGLTVPSLEHLMAKSRLFGVPITLFPGGI